MHRLFRNHPIVFLLTVLFLVCLIAAAVLLIYRNHQQKWVDAHPLSDPDVGFQMYVPTKLPDGFKITGKRISVKHERFYTGEGDPNKIIRASVDMNLREGNWVYAIREWRAAKGDKVETITALRNYDSASIKPSCTQRTSPQRYQYRLCHWLEYGRISVYEIKFIKGGTFIDTTFPSTKDRALTPQEIDIYVDSFRKADPEGLPMIVDAV